MATTFCTATPEIVGTLIMKFASCHNPAPKILRRRLEFLKICLHMHYAPSRKHSNYDVGPLCQRIFYVLDYGQSIHDGHKQSDQNMKQRYN